MAVYHLYIALCVENFGYVNFYTYYESLKIILFYFFINYKFKKNNN